MLNFQKPLLIRCRAVCSSNFKDSVDEVWLYSKMISTKNEKLRDYAIEFFNKNPEKLPFKN
jgi:hypothetical protein